MRRTDALQLCDRPQAPQVRLEQPAAGSHPDGDQGVPLPEHEVDLDP
jgi:hypothetical protein